MEEKERSDFGRGFIYNLVLFAKHKERYSNDKKIYEEYKIQYQASTWFNAASDHLYELQLPEKLLGEELTKRFKDWQDKCLEWRLDYKTVVTEKDYLWAFKELEEMIMEVDKLLGVESEKASFN